MGLQRNVEDAYRFLMKTYQTGDRLYLFGFSRGAFTVRSLAGMLYRVGLLPSSLDNLVEYASEIYNKEGDNLDQGFKETFCCSCKTHFIGVWDTVESLLWWARDRFHDHRLNPEISHAYHAVSIDEKRMMFPPALWDEQELIPKQNMQQVWFAGVHSDTGGWYEERGLSDIALEWMLRHAQHKGMHINEDKMNQLNQTHWANSTTHTRECGKCWEPTRDRHHQKLRYTAA